MKKEKEKWKCNNKLEHSVPLSEFEQTDSFLKPCCSMDLTIDIIWYGSIPVVITQEWSKYEIFFKVNQALLTNHQKCGKIYSSHKLHMF